MISLYAGTINPENPEHADCTDVCVLVDPTGAEHEFVDRGSENALQQACAYLITNFKTVESLDIISEESAPVSTKKPPKKKK